MKPLLTARKQSICFEQSPAMVLFRQNVGNANRLLNTTLVGIETLKVNNPIKPDDLVVAWAKPKSVKEWSETRDFALRAAMISLVDGVDQYLRTVTQIPGFVARELHDKLNGRQATGEKHRPHLSERVAALCAQYAGVVHPAYPLAIDLLATWRNKLVHRNSKHGLSENTLYELPKFAEFFRSNHGGVEISSALKSYKEGNVPDLSQVSTLIASSHNFVRLIDSHLLYLQDAEAYVLALVKYIIFSSSDEKPALLLERFFFKGGSGSAGALHAAFLKMGGNHHLTNRTASAPTISRERLNVVLGMSRNNAAKLLGITRPKTGPGG